MWSSLLRLTFLSGTSGWMMEKMPLETFIGIESAQLPNSSRICIFAYSVLADVIDVYKLLLKLLAAAAVASVCEMDYMAASCQLY